MNAESLVILYLKGARVSMFQLSGFYLWGCVGARTAFEV